VIHEFDVRSLWRGMESDRIARLRAWRAVEIDDIVIDHDGGHNDVCASFPWAVGEKSNVDQHASFDFANALGCDLLCELPDDQERIAGKSGSLIRVVFIDEGESAVGLDAIRKIGIATGDEDEVTFECAVLVDSAYAVDARMEAVIGAELGEEGAFGEDFRGGSGHEHLGGVEGVYDFSGIERVELDAEIRVSKFGATDDLLDALRQTGFRLCAERRGQEAEKEH